MLVVLRILAIIMIVGARLGTADAPAAEGSQMQTMQAAVDHDAHDNSTPSCDDIDDDQDGDVAVDAVLVPAAPAIVPPSARCAAPPDEPAAFVARGHQQELERPPAA